MIRSLSPGFFHFQRLNVPAYNTSNSSWLQTLWRWPSNSEISGNPYTTALVETTVEES